MKYEPVEQWELDRHHGPRRGAVVFSNVARRKLATHGLAGTIGIYNRRKVRGSSRTWSLHAVGRALDIPVTGPEVGNLLALHIILRADRLGVCEVIGPMGRWTPDGRSTRQGAAQHQNHVHIGLTRAFSDGRTSPALWEALLSIAWDS